MAKKKAGRRTSDPESLRESAESLRESAESLRESPDGLGETGRVDRERPVEFETAVEEIEQIVRGLEGGEWSLSTSLREYERAIGRLQTCHVLLQDAERHVSLLSGFDAEGNPVTEPIEGDPGEGLEAKRQSRSRHRGVKSDGGVKSGGGVTSGRRAATDRDVGDRDVDDRGVGETSGPSDRPGLF